MWLEHVCEIANAICELRPLHVVSGIWMDAGPELGSGHRLIGGVAPFDSLHTGDNLTPTNLHSSLENWQWAHANVAVVHRIRIST